MGNTFKKIIAVNSRIPRMRCPSRNRRPLGHQADTTKIEHLHGKLELKY
jgi:hypothetical protein